MISSLSSSLLHCTVSSANSGPALLCPRYWVFWYITRPTRNLHSYIVFNSTFHLFLYPSCYIFVLFFLFPSKVLLSWGQQSCTTAVSSLLKLWMTAEGRGWDQTPRCILSRIIHIMSNVLIQITLPRLTTCTVIQDNFHLPLILPLLPHFDFASVFH